MYLSDVKLLADVHTVRLATACPSHCTLPAAQALFRLQEVNIIYNSSTVDSCDAECGAGRDSEGVEALNQI
jgi:hypothetical protein